MLSTELIENILTLIQRRTIMLVGDLFLDQYLDIDASLNEPSIETGLTAYQIVNVRNYAGALGTVLNNLRALGVDQILPITFLGNDMHGLALSAIVRQDYSRIGDSGIVATTVRRTPVYCKPMLNEGGVIRELNRMDIKNRTPTPREVEDAIIDRLEQNWDTADAVIVLDQVSEPNCGVVTDRVRERIAELAADTPEKFVLADSRERIGEFHNVSIKPNAAELQKAGDVSQLFSQGVRAVFLTGGESGISLWEGGKLEAQRIPAFPVSGPIDICGAGDSCSAGIVCAELAGATLAEAAAFGNLVASITIQQIGVTGTATPEQVRARWREVRGT